MNHTLRRPEEQLAATYGEALAAELELESKMVSLGRDQVRKAVAAARERGNESGTGYGRTLVGMSVVTIAEAIERFKEKAKQGAGRRHIALKYLDQVDADVAGFIAMKVVVDSLTGKRQLLQRVAIHIGRRIEDEVRFTRFKDTDARMYNRALERAKKGGSYHRKKSTMAGYDRRFNEDEWTPWPEQDCLHLGAALVDMIQQTGLVEIGDEVQTRRDTVKILQPTQRLMEWIEAECARSEMLHPAHMPMVVKPLDWTDPFNGGYLTQDAQGRNALVKSPNMNYLSELADHADQMPMVYEAVNALQATRWHINRDVMQVIAKMWDLGHPLAGLPSREDIQYCPCPVCGESIPLPGLHTKTTGGEHACLEDNEEALREWKREAHHHHASNVSMRSKRLALAKALRIAETYADYEAIYFPYQLDFRGRVYAIPSFNPQGNDVTKGLLQFADAKPIEDGLAAGWLAIHGANVFGYDKAALADRIVWVEEREQEIAACAADPFSNTLWQEADKPWQFLAFCFEWAGFMEQGFGYQSRLAVALDGSCSGIQHFSAMLLDETGGKAVNLLPSEVPADIYQRVCDKVVEKLERIGGELSSTIAAKACSSDASSSSLKGGEAEAIAEAIAVQAEARGSWDEEVYAAAWLRMGLSRKTTKRQVMTLPYGSTRYSCRDYTVEWYRDQLKAGFTDPFGQGQAFGACLFLSDLIWDSIGEVVVAARDAMGWLQKCAKVVANEELPVYWTTPVGFRVMQQYKNTSSRRVKTKLGDAVVKLSLAEEKSTIDKRRMANAISPNFVHSMDATHLVMSVCYAKDNGINHFAMIHDSFGCHAADTNMLAACLREAFVDLYSDMDVLEDFRQQIIRQVDEGEKDTVPAIPPKGNLCLDEVRGSDFFFA
jgi:DNA-directed RNA polymerase